MSLAARIGDLATRIGQEIKSVASRVGVLEDVTYKTVNGEVITGTGDITIPAGVDGTNVTITTVNTQAAYDAATPGPTQLIVRIA